MNQRYDVVGWGAMFLAVAIVLALGDLGPKIEWKLNSAGLAAWVQAIVSAFAIVAVYYAATIPVRAEREAKAQENSSRARGLALLLIPELVALLGALQAARANGTIFDPPVLPSALLLERSDQLFLLGDPGGNILQTIGLLSGMAAQTLRFQKLAGVNPNIISPKNQRAANSIWNNHLESLNIAIKNIEEATEGLQKLI